MFEKYTYTYGEHTFLLELKQL